MAVVKRVIINTERLCYICEKYQVPGTVMVKDRRKKKKTGKTLYACTTCYKGDK